MAADVEKSDQWIAAKVRYWQTLKKILLFFQSQ
jgi:hypothetical protein